jgi:hypothetical protein
MQPLRDFCRRGRLKQEFYRLLQVGTSLLNCVTLTRNVYLGAKRNKSIVLPLDNRSELPTTFHIQRMSNPERESTATSHC